MSFKNIFMPVVAIALAGILFFVYQTHTKTGLKNASINAPGVNISSPELRALYHKAYEAYNAKDYDGAINHLNEALKLDPKHLPSLDMMGAIYIMREKYADAQQYLNKALAIEPDNYAVNLHKGIVAQALGKFNEAEGFYSVSIRSNSSVVEAREKRASFRKNQTKNYSGAVEDYTYLVQNGKDTKHNYYLLCWLHNELRTYSEGINYCEKATQLDPSNTSLQNSYGTALMHTAQYQEAEKVFKKAISKKPNNSLNYYNLGLVYAKQNDDKKAIEFFTKAIDINPDYANALSNRGFSYKNLKQYKAALRDQKRVVALRPRSAADVYNKGLVEVSLRDWAAAKASFSRAIQFNSSFAWARVWRGYVNYYLGDYEGALKDFIEFERFSQSAQAEIDFYTYVNMDLEELPAPRPSEDQFYYWRGYFNLMAGNAYSAGQNLEKALKYNSDLPSAYIMLAGVDLILKNSDGQNYLKKLHKKYPKQILDLSFFALFNQTDQQGVYNVLNKLKETFPSDPLGYIFASGLYGTQGQYDIALTNVEEILEFFPYNPQLYYMRGRIYLIQGKTKAAITDLDKAIEFNEDYCSAYFLRAIAYAREGNKEAADKDIKTFADLRETYYMLN